MAKKKAYLIVGPALPRVDELHETLAAHADVLSEAGLALPEITPADLFHADVELRRTHKAEGLRRKDVEGAWARVCRRAERTGSDVLIAQDRFAAADDDQAALLLDGLAAFRVHVVVTSAEGADDVLAAWTSRVKPERLHQVEGTTVDEVLGEVAALALRERAAHLEQRIEKLGKKRRKLKKRLEQIDAA